MQTIMSGVCVSAAAVCVLPPPKPVGAAVSFCCVEFCPPCMVLSMQAWVCPPWRCLKRDRRSDSLQGSSRLRRTQSRLHLSARPHRISPEEFPRSVPCPAALHPVFRRCTAALSIGGKLGALAGIGYFRRRAAVIVHAAHVVAVGGEIASVPVMTCFSSWRYFMAFPSLISGRSGERGAYRSAFH